MWVGRLSARLTSRLDMLVVAHVAKEAVNSLPHRVSRALDERLKPLVSLVIRRLGMRDRRPPQFVF